MIKKVLVVDDEPFITRSVEFLLRNEGYEVLIAYSGQEALDIATQELPQLILLDVMIPEINGYEVCKRLKAQPETKSAYIMILTARGERIEEQHAYESGADEFLQKPFSPRKLLARVRAISDQLSQN